MQKRDGRIIYSPSDLITFLESPFASWMDRHHVERPGVFVPDPQPADQALVAKMGDEHEARAIAAMRAAGRDVWEPTSGRRGAFDETLGAMRAGREIVYQAALRHGDFEGHADFLLRVDRPSALGAFSYEVSDAKLARRPKPYFLLQLCAYAAMIEAIQGVRPASVHVLTGDGHTHSFRTEDYFHYFRCVERAFLESQARFDPNNPPIPQPHAEHRRWSTLAERLLEERDHPSRVAGMTSVQVTRLADAGITTMNALAESTVAHVRRMDDRVLDRLRRQARLQITSAGLERPRFELIAPDHEEPRRGLAMLPPPSKGDVFFDMEGYPFLDGGLEYLFGATYLENGKRCFFETWAHDAASEKVAFEGLVDWLTQRLAADPAMHVYHYAAYEVSALRRLMGKHGTREEEVDALLRAEVFVDLYRVVKQSVLIGEARYSLKNVEHLYRGRRAGDVATAGDSIVEYARWLEEPDGADWRSSKILADIRAYNIEDCESTLDLRDWLLARQEEAEIAFVPLPTGHSANDETEEGEEEDILAQTLRGAIPDDRSGDPEHWRIQQLLADMVDFHWREAKPLYWAMFHRRDCTHEELAEDPDCLGQLRRTDTPTRIEKRSTYYEYSFDPNQDTKLGAGKCLYSHSLARTELASLDGERGIAVIKAKSEHEPPPEVISLIPDEHVRARPIDGAVRAVVEAWAAGAPLSRALDTLLRRSPPRLRGGVSLHDGVTPALLHLHDSTLAIQGPPGSGKTTTAAHAIAELIRRGARVGVTSNGHKAIEKLMTEVLKAAAASSSPLRATKIKTQADEDIVTSGLVEHAPSMRHVDPAANLVGGTAWAFCNDAAIGAFDYLFVDEASQVSLANVIGMSRATRNIVLLGDQMQLGQPLKGSHPGESGQSALGYLLGDHRTIPADLGVFLGTSWRLHPAVCRVVSEAVYEGRLEAAPGNEERVVRVPANGGRLITEEAGVVFIPVPHEGNAQASDEEVAAIAAIVDELLGRELIEKPNHDGSVRPPRSVTADDILVVAPYNMQVRALRKALPARVRVGSVDKFQGQEAAIAIVSMCASSGDYVARGLEFLFSANRLNVALSRAQSLAIVVGSPELARTRIKSVEQMRLVNFLCRVAASSSSEVC